MSLIGSEILAGASGQAGAAAYEIEQSLRFNSGDSTYLNWTPGSAGDRTLWTWSAWIKRSGISSTVGLFGSYAANNNNDYLEILFASGNTLLVQGYNTAFLNTSQVFRDTSAWYHIVIAVDTSNATADDRIKIYVNGEQVTDFGTRNNPSSGGNLGVNQAGVHRLGRRPNGTDYFNGYMAEVNFIDGSALDHEDFGELDDNGVWRPIQYAGSYTGNSFYLKFASGDGTDSSGLSNTWTANGFTVNPDSYVLATKTSGTFSTGTLRDVFDTNSGNYGGVYQEATTGSEAASTIDIEFSSPLSGTITVDAADGTGGTNTGGQYQLIDSTDTVQVTQARPTNNTTFTHTGLSDITKLRMYGGSSGLGGILIGRFESSDQTIRTADWLGEGDVMSDTPTNNWCTLNLLDKGEYGAGISLSEGNLRAVSTSSDRHVRSTFFLPTSGKWYFEATATTVNSAGYLAIGLYHASGSLTSTAIATAQGRWYTASGYGNGSGWGDTYDDGDTIGIAVDMDSGKIWAAKNNTWQASGDPAAGTNAMYSDLLTAYSSDGWSPVCGNWQSGNTADFNFGQRGFAYTPPTGFKALSTSNLPAPDIADGSEYFKTLAYSGLNNGSTTPRNIDDVGWKPDLVWIKNRGSATYNHVLFDAVRGVNISLTTNNTAADTDSSPAGFVSEFRTEGFALKKGSLSGAAGSGNVDRLGHTYVAWNWLAGNGTSTPSGGSIASTVSANPSAGFSIVSYEGNGTAGATVAHGLGVAPSMIIIKNRDNSAGRWIVYHSVLGGTKYIRLDSNTFSVTDSGIFNDTDPSSTTFTLGTNYYINGNTENLIAYCFAEVEGYSKFGSYTGNGATTDGPFVWCGFRPSWVMWKRDGSDGWVIKDVARSPYNVMSEVLYANLSNAESSTQEVDFLSNGFKIRTNSGASNTSGNTYYFMAFASSPFGGSGVSPATAR